jgi:hypothetical protein
MRASVGDFGWCPPRRQFQRLAGQRHAFDHDRPGEHVGEGRQVAAVKIRADVACGRCLRVEVGQQHPLPLHPAMEQPKQCDVLVGAGALHMLFEREHPRSQPYTLVRPT